jgi:hypothetical protein
MPEPEGGGVRAGEAPPEQQRDRRPSPATGADQNYLPSGPLLDAVRRLVRLRRQSLREFLGPELFIAYCHAHARGTVNLVTLEWFCDEILGWHPRMLYGDAYDQAAFDPPDPV